MLEFFSKIMNLRNDVLGINGRNIELIYELNPRRNFPRVDDKLVTKELLAKIEAPTPATLAIFHGHADLEKLEDHVAGLHGFALKPAQGSGGRGIMIVKRDAQGKLIRPGEPGQPAVGMEDLRNHIAEILSGVYSLEKPTDRAFIEELLEPEDMLGGVSIGGLPDIRIAVHNGRPIMAMTRIPTRQSRGRANLHQGALGLGIDMETGQTTYAVLGNRNVTVHPDTNRPLSTLQIPQWDTILNISLQAAGCAGLGYVGVDIAVDKQRGPLVLELNARPGLNIQLANRRGLRQSLRDRET
ncbi:alpha-L-glutamate ligase-like protein [Candidatus Poribacteria bacterium]|nr:alpha-L-glutamate ligase-like protein [Candidatus Poribacteria bacterium]